MLDDADRTQVKQYGEFITFIHNAIEWENVTYMAYPYFWDTAAVWPFKRFLIHPDPTHRDFLRAGAARLVLTIRPGFEDTFMRLTQTGTIEPSPGTTTSQEAATYVSIGQEIHNQDLTNYRHIPPANLDRTARPLLYALQQDAWNDMESIMGALEEFNKQTGRYPDGPETGLPLRLKSFLTSQPQIVTGTNPPAKTFAGMLWDHLRLVPVAPGNNFDDPNTTFVDRWGHAYHYTKSSAATPVLHGGYELVCYGSNNQAGTDPRDPLSEDITSWADGLLLAQWYEIYADQCVGCECR